MQLSERKLSNQDLKIQASVLSTANDSLASEQEKISLVQRLSKNHVFLKKTIRSKPKAKATANVNTSLIERIGNSVTVETVPTKNERVTRKRSDR